VRLAYVGDGRNNLARSLMIGATKMGVDLRILAPPELSPAPALVKELMNEAAVGARILVTREPREALEGCDAVYNDVWVSMGEEDLLAERVALLRGFKVTPRLMALTGRPDTIYRTARRRSTTPPPNRARAPECARCRRRSRPAEPRLRPAENCMHTAKAVMVVLTFSADGPDQIPASGRETWPDRPLGRAVLTPTR
jgi:ornithine carbamoyltransferase